LERLQRISLTIYRAWRRLGTTKQRRHHGWQSLPLLIISPFVEGKPPMPTRNISLTPEQDAFIEDVVRAGEYQNASEAVRDALRVLQQRRREDLLRLKTLRMQIRAGVEALDRGDFAEVDDAELDLFLEELRSPAEKRAR
jgi:antitoxin ParD1/3/4